MALFNRCFLLLLLTCWLGDSEVWAQSGRGQGVNYKLVPNLEAMKDNSPTPDFTLPILLEEGQASAKLSPWRWLRERLASSASNASAKKISLSDLRGKLVFLNFWASWCVPCREEMPEMERLYQQYKANGFVILAVNVKDVREDALAFVKELKLTYPTVFDPDGEVGVLYGAWGLPATYLIGPKGEGLARMWGPARWDSAGAKRLVQDLLEGKR